MATREELEKERAGLVPQQTGLLEVWSKAGTAADACRGRIGQIDAELAALEKGEEAPATDPATLIAEAEKYLSKSVAEIGDEVGKADAVVVAEEGGGKVDV